MKKKRRPTLLEMTVVGKCWVMEWGGGGWSRVGSAGFFGAGRRT
jgi:hypothetical protein